MNVFSNNENIVRNITGLIKKKSMKNLNKNITKRKQNNNFIVYIHIRPDINEPFYVGKGVPGREIRTCGRNQYWHNIVNKNNGIFESKILFEGLSEEEALLKEREIELDLKNKGYILTNIIECGVKAGTTGMKHSEESKRKISERLKGHISPNKGKKQSKETCDKKSKSMMGVMNKSILQYDLEDNFIKDWSSISEAYLSLNKKITNGCINLACKGKIKTAFGYKWKYKNNQYEKNKI
jgi:hypothetical protein